MENNSANTAVSSSAFTRSLEGFRRRLSAEDLENFELTTFESLELAINEIQRVQAQRRALRNLNKVKPFLRFLQDYARVIEQFVSAKPDFLAFIWGPIKLCLQIASRLDEAFDALLDAYARIGEALPIFSAIDGLLASQRHGPVQQILADVYEDILTFHKRAVVFFKQPAWKIAFDTTIRSFGDQFGDVAKNLERSKELLVQSASISHFHEAQNARLLIIREFSALREHERHEQKTTTIDWLSSVSWNDQHEKIREKRLHFPDTTLWIFNTASLCDWLRNDENCSPVFWLYGIPGAGKTFLFNSIIDGVNERLPCVHFVYFYCRYNESAKRTLNGIVRSLIAQILALNPACLPYLYDKALSSGELTLTSTKLCTHILTKLAEYHDQLIIGVDGLDECEEPEKRSTLALIGSILKATQVTRNVRFFLTSRKERLIERSLRSAIALEIRPHHLERDIKSYVRVRTSELSKIHFMDAERQQWITTEISQRSHGMFLLARLVMDNLMDQDCEESLNEELNNKILPQGIDEAYGRILVRMQRKDQANRTWERAKLALDLIVRATRSVKTHDIQGALSICTKDRSIKFEQRKSVKPLEDLLGSIVEVHPDNLVTLVHPTARDFLLQHHSNYFINPSAADLKLATLCTSYLTFECFSPSLDGPSIKRSVGMADYAFQEYATFNWIIHLESLDSHCLDSNRDETSRLRRSLALLHQRYLKENAKMGLNSGKEGTEAESIDVSEELNAWRRVYERVEILHRGDGLQNSEPMPGLIRRLLEVRVVLEELSSQVIKESPTLTEAYGEFLYKCPMTRCTRFFSGFATRYQRDEHLKGHERNHKCSKKDCDYSELGFASEEGLDKHVQLCHGTSAEGFTFPNKRRVSTSKALQDAIDRDDALAIRSICDPVTVKTISETGFLLRAVKKKRLNAAMVVMELLGTTSEVGHQDKKGRTALHEAVVEVAFETLVQQILKTDVDIQGKDMHGETPLSKALTGGHFHAARILLSTNEAGLESCSRSYAPFYTGVLLAAAAGQDDIIQSIFAVSVARVDVRRLSKWISAALNNAAFHNHRSTVSLILELGRSTGIEKHYEGILRADLPKGLEAITQLLMKRAIEPEFDGTGETSKKEFQDAAGRGDIATVTRILEKGVDINHGTPWSPTALAAASRNGKSKMMKLLLGKGAKVDASGGRWGTPLGAASSEGHITAIKLLLDKGADPDYGILSASQKGHNAVVGYLLEKGGHVNAHGRLGDALNVACFEGHEATVKLLLNNRAGIYARGEIADFEFGKAWSIEVEEHVRLAMSSISRAKDHRGLYSALCLVCRNGHRHLALNLIELLEKGAETEGRCVGKYNHALNEVCGRGDMEIFQVLVQCGADPNYNLAKSLHYACLKEKHEIIHLLLEYGADVHGQNGNGTTTLIMATRIGHKNIARLLLKQGADINAQSLLSHEGTALIAACSSSADKFLIHLLLENGADVNKRGLNTNSNDSALSMACGRRDNVDIVRMLLKKGADVDADSGEALKKASRMGEKATVQLLLEYGAKET